MIWLLLIFFTPGGLNQNYPLGTTLQTLHPCDNSLTTVSYESTLPERQNQYNLDINPLPTDSNILVLKFNSEVTLELKEPDPTFRVRLAKLAVPKNSFRVTFSKKPPKLNVQVFGPAGGTIPYLQSILANYQELCKNPRIGYFDEYIIKQDAVEEKEVTEGINRSLDESCGRRKVVHTELIVNGQPTKPGDWPWHVAILRVERSSLRYICGGTLLSKTLVLTAAHCASIRSNAVVPDALSVHLGKYNLIGGDIGAQERGVFKVIIHPKFDGSTLNNDIALLKLQSEAVFTDYVQPACFWHQQTDVKHPVSVGTVVGWGFDHLDLLSSTLQQITVPIVSELTCLKSNPIFFQRKLDTNKFCAGFSNGTSVCNGDSGGGLMTFVPDPAGYTGKASGAWYVRGIVSLAPSRTDAPICDPDQYTIFTDVEKYQDWLLKYLN